LAFTRAKLANIEELRLDLE
jgi:hypothetical protein